MPHGPAADVAGAERMEQRRSVGGRVVGTEAAPCQQQAQHVGPFQQVPLAPARDRRHPDAGIEQAYQQVALPPCADGGEHAAAARIRRLGILLHAAQDLFVLAQPDEAVRIDFPPCAISSARSSGVLAANVALPAEST